MTNPVNKDEPRYPKGVSYDRHQDRWVGRIMFKRKHYRKYCQSQEEAADWYKAKSMELYGFDRVNVTEEMELSHE